MANDLLKQMVAEKAIEYVTDDMILGIGTGSTTNYFIEHLAKNFSKFKNLKLVCSSIQSENLLREKKIEFLNINEISYIDLTIDGADLVDDNRNLIKGLGGALFREKILAFYSKKIIILIDESKKVDTFGNFKIPIEVSSFGYDFTFDYLKRKKFSVSFRMNDKREFFVTDNGNFIIDLYHKKILQDLEKFHLFLKNIPGVIETGIFYLFNPTILIAKSRNDIKILK